MLSLPQLKAVGLEVVEGLAKGCEAPQEPSELAAVQGMMESMALAMGLSRARFLPVEPSYYEQALEWRRDRLGAESIEELCKSVVLEPLGALSGLLLGSRPPAFSIGGRFKS